MLKICMIVHQDYFQDGRVRRYIESLLEQPDTRIDVICVRGRLDNNEMPSPRVRSYRIPMYHNSGGALRYLYEYFGGFFFYMIYLLALFPFRRYNVIHAHNMPDFLMLTAIIPKLFGAKLVLDIHDPMPEFYMSKFEKSAESGIAKVMRFQEQLSARIANHVVTANPNFRENIIQRGLAANKITVVTNFPDRQIFDREKATKAYTNDKFTLVYPGTMAPRYGLAIAIRALPELRKHIPEIYLKIIGSHNHHTDELKALAQELKVSDIVEFHAIVPVEEVPRQMLAADIGIYTALPDAHMSIATPSKVLEYAVMGLPIVAARIPVLQSLFSEEAIAFFTPGDVDEFAQRVQELYKASERRKSMVEASDKELVYKADWSYEFRKYYDILNKLVAHKEIHPAELPQPTEERD